MKGYTLKNSVTTEDQRAFFPGWLWLEDSLIDELMRLDEESSNRRKIETGPGFEFPVMPDASESLIWQTAEVGQKVHIQRLYEDVGLVRFYQQEKHENSPSYCDTPVSTFMSYKTWLPWYVRIE